MSTHLPTYPPFWLALAMALAACSSSDEPGGSKGPVVSAGGQTGDAGGATSSSGGSGQSGSASGGMPNGGLPQGGASAGGQASGTMCGLETCSGARECCPSTGKCYTPNFEGCSSIKCTVTSNDTGGSAGAANCCPNGLSHCAANDICYHTACVGCCP